MSDTYKMKFEMKKNAENAILVIIENNEFWLPKSQVTFEDDIVEIPEWLVRAKGLINLPPKADTTEIFEHKLKGKVVKVAPWFLKQNDYNTKFNHINILRVKREAKSGKALHIVFSFNTRLFEPELKAEAEALGEITSWIPHFCLKWVEEESGLVKYDKYEYEFNQKEG